MDWKGKVVVVTGASSGIGAETARLVASRGAKVALMARNLEKLQTVRDSLPVDASVLIVAVDVSDEAAVEKAFRRVLAEWGQIDVLVNNAGFGVFEPFVATPSADFVEMMNVNYMGIVYCTKAVLTGMLARRSGYIVNVASVAGKVATNKTAAYSASKHAVIGLSNVLRMELHGSGVHLATINPGPVETNFFDRADPSGNYMKNLRTQRWLVLSARTVAEQVLRAVDKRLPEITLPWFMSFSVTLAQLFPRVFTAISRRMLDKK